MKVRHLPIASMHTSLAPRFKGVVLHMTPESVLGDIRQVFRTVVSLEGSKASEAVELMHAYHHAFPKHALIRLASGIVLQEFASQNHPKAQHYWKEILPEMNRPLIRVLQILAEGDVRMANYFVQDRAPVYYRFFDNIRRMTQALMPLSEQVRAMAEEQNAQIFDCIKASAVSEGDPLQVSLQWRRLLSAPAFALLEKNAEYRVQRLIDQLAEVARSPHVSEDIRLEAKALFDDLNNQINHP